MRIGDLETLQQFFRRTPLPPIFGAGVYAFHRLGPEEFVPDYRILALRYSDDTKLIEEDIEVHSLEKGMGTAHISEPRNATTVLKNERVQSYLSQFLNPYILVYKTSQTMERLAEMNGWTLIQNPAHFGKPLFENKIIFRKILNDLGVFPPPGETVRLSSEDVSDAAGIRYFHTWETRYGLPFVIQHPTRGGGKGTFFIGCKEDAARAFRKITGGTPLSPREKSKPITLIVAKFIHGPSPSITGCVTRHGILSTNLQHQILDSPFLYNPAKGSGLFCGHDWSSSSSFPSHINNEAYVITDRIGTYLRKKGYRGIFGIDFVLDETRGILYPTECNARLLGSFPSLTMIQLRNEEPPILAFHVLEFLNLPYEIDIKEINRLMRGRKTGAQVILHNLSQRWAKNHHELRAGVYRIIDAGVNASRLPSSVLTFVRPGYKLSHVSKQNEFLVTEGVPFKKSHFSPNRRLVRIVTLKHLLDTPPNYLTKWAQVVARLVYQGLDMRPIRFIRIRKLLEPGFLAKG